MKRIISTISIVFLASTIVLSSCSWKKAKWPSASGTEGIQANEKTSEIDYHSGAVIIEETESASGSEVEKQQVSSWAALWLLSTVNSEKTEDCDALPNKNDIQACHDIILFKKGTEDHDYGSCDKISRARNKQICVSRVSKYLLDFGSCEDIREEGIKKTCFAKNQASTSKMAEQTAMSYKKSQEIAAEAAKASTANERVSKACDQFTGTNRNYCYGLKVLEEIQKSGDTSLCSIISDAATKNACEQKASAQTNKAILDKAIEAKDSTLCESLPVQQDRDLCKKIVSGGK